MCYHFKVAKRAEDSERTSTAKMGWALKMYQSTKKRFSEKKKSYLMKMFQLGETTGFKADPSVVSKQMIQAKDDNVNSLFNSDEFLASQQIKSFFLQKTIGNSKGHR